MPIPADFALIRRRATVTRELGDAQVLLRFLAAKCDGRAGSHDSVGFRAA